MPEPGAEPGPADIARRWAARLAGLDGIALPAHELETHLLDLALEARAELDSARAARDDAARRFIDLYAAAPVGVALGDADGLIRDVNPALVQLLEHSRSQLVGTPLTDLAATGADAEALAAALDTAALPGRRPAGNGSACRTPRTARFGPGSPWPPSPATPTVCRTRS